MTRLLKDGRVPPLPPRSRLSAIGQFATSEERNANVRFRPVAVTHLRTASTPAFRITLTRAWRQQDSFIGGKAFREPHQRQENGSLQHQRSGTAEAAPSPAEQRIAFDPYAVPPNTDLRYDMTREGGEDEKHPVHRGFASSPTIADLGSGDHTKEGGAMFTVSNVRDRLLWVSVTLKAEADMFLEADRLRFGRLGAPVLDKRVLKVKAGETFTIRSRSSEGFRVGERLPLDQVAQKLPISLKWRTIATA